MRKPKDRSLARGKHLPRPGNDFDALPGNQGTLLGRLISKLLRGGEGIGRTRPARPILETLEPRLLLSATPPLPEPSFTQTLNYTATAATHATLEVVDTGAANLTLELVSGTSTVLASEVLNQNTLVAFTGSGLGDTLAINLNYTKSGSDGSTPYAIKVEFNGGTESTPGSVSIANSGGTASYTTAGLFVTSTDAVSMSGSLNLSGDLDVQSQSTITLASGTTITDAGNDIRLASDDTGTPSVLGPELPGNLTPNSLIQDTAATGVALQGATITGNNISIDAESTVTVNSTLSSLFDGAVKLGAVDATATSAVNLTGANVISAAGTLTIEGGSSVTSTLSAAPDSSSNSSSTDAAVGITTVDSSADVSIGGSSTLTSTGALSIDSSNTVNASTTADGSAGSSSGTAVGAALAVDVIGGATETDVLDTAALQGSTVAVDATSNRTVATDAISTQGGASDSGTPNDTQSKQQLSSNNAQTSDGAMNIAAAVAVTNVTGGTTVDIGTGGSITATAGAATVTSVADLSGPTGGLSTVANGSATSSGATGIGAAAAINTANVESLAELTGATTFNATGGVALTANMTTALFGAQATSGAGGSNVGVAGALAINSGQFTSNAEITGLANIAITGAGNVSLLANGAASDAALAQAGSSGGKPGIGASVAIDDAGGGAQAAIQNGAALTGAHSLTLTATDNDSANTTAQSGAAGGTATAAAAAIAAESGTTATTIGTGSILSAASLDQQATRTSSTVTDADGTAAGFGVGVGASLALTVSNEKSTASVARNVTTTGDATLAATIDGSSSTTGLGSDQGALPGSTPVNTLIGEWTTYLSAQGFAPVPGNLPAAATPDGQVGVAAAIAVNLGAPVATASVASGATLNVGGAFSLSAAGTYAASAVADATAVDVSTGVAGAVAIDAATPGADASIAGSVSAASAAVTSTLSGTSTATANSGSGLTNVGVAGALAINVGDGTSQAATAAGSNLTSTGTAALTVEATDTATDTAAASATAAAGVTGVGASVALNVSTNSAEAGVAGALNSGGALNVLANGMATVTTVADGGAAGGTGVAPALSLAIEADQASALIASGAVAAVAGSLEVRAYEKSRSAGTASGGAAGTKTAVGASLAVDIADGGATAAVAGQATVTGGVTIDAVLDGGSSAVSAAGALGASASGTPADDLISSALSFAQNPARDWVGSNVTAPSAKLPGGALAIGATVALNIDLSKASGQLDSTANVTAGSITVTGESAMNATASASGRTVDDTLSGFGFAGAIAVNTALPTTEAFIDGKASGGAITVQTLMDGTQVYGAAAQSGAGVNANGIAGALAVNVAVGTSAARVDDGAALNLGSAGALQVNAAYTTDDTANALSIFSSNPTLGIGLGASIAVNTTVNDTLAEIGAASIANAGSISVAANAIHSVTTEGQAGADTAAALGASVAVSATGSKTTAEMLAGGSALTVGGAVNVTATHSDTIATIADSESSGAQAGAGASIAASVGLDSVTADLARNLSAGGNVTVAATSLDPTSATALAGQSGGYGSQAMDPELASELGLPASEFSLPALPTWSSLILGGSSTVGLALPTLGAAAAISVNVAQPDTLAEIAANTSVASSGSVSVVTEVSYQATSTADASAVGNTATIGFALAGNYAGGTNDAEIGGGATVSGAAISVDAGEAAFTQFTAKAMAGAGGVAAGVAGSIAANAGASTTQAEVGDGAALTATGNVTVTSQSNLMSTADAGGAAEGDNAGVGASLAANLDQHLTEATVGNAQINANAGITIDAIASQGLGATALAGAGAASNSVAGSITLDALVATTEATVNVGAQLDQLAPTSATQTIAVLAQDGTDVIGQAGVKNAGLAANGSASVDASAIQKQTVARLGGKAKAGGDITVDALSNETLSSWAATGSVGQVTIAGSGSLQHLDVTTQAYIDSGANVTTQGSIRVNADEQSRTDAKADASGLSVVAGAGASVAVGWNTKLTEAFIAGADATRADPFNPGHTLGAATVHADGAVPVTADDGTFNVNFGAVDPGGIGAPGAGVASALNALSSSDVFDVIEAALSALTGYVTVVNPPPLDGALSQQREADVLTDSIFDGIAVTATTIDAVSTDANGLGAALAGTPELSGSAAYINSATSAFIAPLAQVSTGATVRVAAGDDAYHMGIGGSASAGFDAGVGAAGDLSMINNTTQAYIAGHVTATNNIEVIANAEEDVLATAAAASAGVAVDLTASMALISINDQTHAYIDDNAYVHAGGSVLVGATDNTVTSGITGEAGLSGFGGAGASATVTLITKDTEAWIGQGATVLADGTAGGSDIVYTGAAGSDGQFPTTEIDGLGVEASSSEQILSVAAGAGGGFGIAFTGSIGFYIPQSTTAAHIDSGATVTASAVNVSAVNALRTFGAAVNFAVSAGLGLAGAFDVGLVRNNTTATIDGNVTATGDVDVYALSQIEGDSFIGGGGVSAGGLSLVASVGLYSIRASFAPIYGLDLLGFLSDGAVTNVQSSLDSQVYKLANTGGDGLAGLLNDYAQGVGGSNAAANAISNAAPVNPTQTAVNATLNNLGTQATVGGKIVAGGNVVVSGQEAITVNLDSSFTFPEVGPSLLALANNRSLLTVGGEAGGFVNLGASIAAGGAISVLGDVSNKQDLSGDTVVNAVSNTVTAAVDGATLSAAGGDVNVLATTENTLDYSALVPAHDQLLQIKSASSTLGSTVDAFIAGNSVVTASGAVTVFAEETGSVSVVADAALFSKDKSFDAAAAIVTNDATNTVSAHIDNSTVTAQGGDVDVKAVSAQAISSYGIGLNVDGGGKFAGAGSYVSTDIDNTIWARTDNSAITAAGSVNVTAADADGNFSTEVTTVSGGAALSLGSVAVGAAITDNTLENNIQAYISGGTVIANLGGVAVTASSDPSLTTAALALSYANSFALGGSVTLNQVKNVVESQISGGAKVTGQRSVLISSTDTPTLFVAAGGLSASSSVAAGAAVALDNVASTVTSNIDGSTVTADTGNVQVLADRNADLTHLIVVGGGVGGTAGVAGSIAVNTFGSTTQASITGASSVTANDDVVVLAQSANEITPWVGTVTVGESASIGGSLLLDEFSDGTSAFISGSTVDASGNAPITVPLADGSSATGPASGVAVIATTANTLSTVNVNAAVSGGVSVALTASVEIMQEATTAYLAGSSIDPNEAGANAAQSVVVRAANNSYLDIIAGEVGVGVVSAGATADVDLVGNTTTAYIAGSSVGALGDVDVTAFSQEAITPIVISGNIGTSVGVAGNVPVMFMTSSTQAYIDSSSVLAGGNLNVIANSDTRLGSRKGDNPVGVIAGALGIGLAGGIGGSVIVDSIATTTKAHITNSTTDAAGATLVQAQSLEDARSYDITAAGGLYVGAAGICHRHQYHAGYRGVHRRCEQGQPQPQQQPPGRDGGGAGQHHGAGSRRRCRRRHCRLGRLDRRAHRAQHHRRLHRQRGICRRGPQPERARQSDTRRVVDRAGVLGRHRRRARLGVGRGHRQRAFLHCHQPHVQYRLCGKPAGAEFRQQQPGAAAAQRRLQHRRRSEGESECDDGGAQRQRRFQHRRAAAQRHVGVDPRQRERGRQY